MQISTLAGNSMHELHIRQLADNRSIRSAAFRHDDVAMNWSTMAAKSAVAESNQQQPQSRRWRRQNSLKKIGGGGEASGTEQMKRRGGSNDDGGNGCAAICGKDGLDSSLS
jgi:hypothetical protein